MLGVIPFSRCSRWIKSSTVFCRSVSIPLGLRRTREVQVQMNSIHLLAPPQSSTASCSSDCFCFIRAVFQLPERFANSSRCRPTHWPSHPIRPTGSCSSTHVRAPICADAFGQWQRLIRAPLRKIMAGSGIEPPIRGFFDPLLCQLSYSPVSGQSQRARFSRRSWRRIVSRDQCEPDHGSADGMARRIRAASRIKFGFRIISVGFAC